MSIKADHRHLYLQVIDAIKKDIESGLYKEKEKLPSEFELSKKLGVSRATLREALRLLEEENVLVRKHGVGTFVKAKPVFSSGIEELFSVTDLISRVGKTPGSTYLSTNIIEATDDDVAQFSSKNLHKLAKLERVRTADDEPVVYCIDKLPEHLVPLDHLHLEDSLFQLLDTYSHKRIAYAVTYIEPVGYHERISPILHCDKNQPLLLLKQMHYTSEDEPVLLSNNYFRTDQFGFYVLRKRV
ncbi:GntR family transcriptional regulator [Pontibacillus halophilus JSM 076056 = DSM 19796]|uniref:GntR family transcriptional regulator n=1 Tax=Pontibacillus halophilus JSM 076056 = DSM 19796 TaxID=1385510 RepID=A0A0A5GPM8_9BACI|nr:GntR family transcriptional regulator [Pontibacillus halophilus]KGX93115.1 GntR family transcriptional regulator [Pontibacillus halophilus JSM 076056 = DSM 19796]